MCHCHCHCHCSLLNAGTFLAAVTFSGTSSLSSTVQCFKWNSRKIVAPFWLRTFCRAPLPFHRELVQVDSEDSTLFLRGLRAVSVPLLLIFLGLLSHQRNHFGSDDVVRRLDGKLQHSLGDGVEEAVAQGLSTSRTPLGIGTPGIATSSAGPCSTTGTICSSPCLSLVTVDGCSSG